MSAGPFRPGDRVQLTDPRGKPVTITLQRGGEYHTHRGLLAHDELIGKPEGTVVASTNDVRYVAFRPLLTDFVMSMPRGAAIIYPKDAGQILVRADIGPGATVVEAGVGSGALSLWLLRAIGAEGRLLSFERREDFAAVAKANVRAHLGAEPKNWSVTVGDLQQQLPAAAEPGTVDRVLLDMLAPWECLEVAATVLRPGGVLLCYVATVTQLSRVAEAIRASGDFMHPDSSETMVRGWHVDGLAVRPDHRMVAHTGFLLTARRLAPGAVLPEPQRRGAKPEFAPDDIEAWTPGAVGARESSDKRLRRTLRDAEAIAAAASEANAPDASAADPGR